MAGPLLVALHIPSRLNILIRTHIHICIHMYIHTYIRTYIHTYIRSHIHTYIHAYIGQEEADSDMAGPLLVALALGAAMLLRGKVLCVGVGVGVGVCVSVCVREDTEARGASMLY